MPKVDYRALVRSFRDFMGSCDGHDYNRMIHAGERAAAMQVEIQRLNRENALLRSALSSATRNMRGI